MIDNAGSAFAQTEALLAENRDGISETIQATQQITSRLDSTSLVLRDSATKIRSIIYSDTLTQILTSTRDVLLKLQEADLGNLITELGKVVERTNHLMVKINQDVERGRGDFLVSLRELRTTLENLNEASNLIQEDPSVLVRGTDYNNAPDKDLD